MDKELKEYIDKKTKDIKEEIRVASTVILFIIVLAYALLLFL